MSLQNNVEHKLNKIDLAYAAFKKTVEDLLKEYHECHWTELSDNAWKTECGQEYTADKNEAAKWRICPNCGRPINTW